MKKREKTPLCNICQQKLFAVSIIRQRIGFICPRCDFALIKDPTKVLEKLKVKVNTKLAEHSISGKKPIFTRRIHTRCSKCLSAEYIQCRKSRTKSFKGQAFGLISWTCWCTNPKHKEYAWSQNVPKIHNVRFDTSVPDSPIVSF